MKNSEGFTLVEVLAVVTILGTLSALLMPSVLWGNNAGQNATQQIAGNFKLARAKAMSKTSAYRVTGVSADLVKVEYAKTCDANTLDWKVASEFDVELPKNSAIVAPVTVNGVQVNNLADWQVCYDSRGIAQQNVILPIINSDNQQVKQVEVLLGGAIETQ